MLEDHLKSLPPCGRLRASIVAPYIDAFADWLARRRYSPLMIDQRLRSLAAWAGWMEAHGLTVADTEIGVRRLAEELAAGRVRYAPGPNNASRVAAGHFLAFLREQKVVPVSAAEPSPAERLPIIGEFRQWTTQNRGLRASSLDQYQRVVVDLIEGLGEDATAYNAASLRAFVLDRTKGYGIWHARLLTTSIRAYLRFLAATGRCAATLTGAIPRYAAWKLSSTPRFLEAADVEKVLAGCRLDWRAGRRDRAVLLLLARLGLRAGDVSELHLEDIDWKNGRFAVAGKARRSDWLPLPQDVGDAILEWLRDRPRIATTHVFTRVLAPFAPLRRGSVTHIVDYALRRAGVDAPVHGAHLFRHSAATAMLRAGVSLAGVGAVLRHRSPSTTAHYAKVDFGLLEEIAQPWPEVSPC